MQQWLWGINCRAFWFVEIEIWTPEPRGIFSGIRRNHARSCIRCCSVISAPSAPHHKALLGAEENLKQQQRLLPLAHKPPGTSTGQSSTWAHRSALGQGQHLTLHCAWSLGVLQVHAEQKPKKDFSLAEMFQKGMEIKATEEDLALGQRQAILT